jgi:hypothetical protein
MLQIRNIQIYSSFKFIDFKREEYLKHVNIIKNTIAYIKFRLENIGRETCKYSKGKQKMYAMQDEACRKLISFLVCMSKILYTP